MGSAGPRILTVISVTADRDRTRCAETGRPFSVLSTPILYLSISHGMGSISRDPLSVCIKPFTDGLLSPKESFWKLPSREKSARDQLLPEL